MLNKVTLIGRVGDTPRISQTESGKKIADLPLATSEYWKDKSTGERKERTEWHKIVVFSDGLVNLVDLYVKKGSKIYVEGQLRTRKWTDKNKVDRYVTEVVLQGFGSSLILLDSKGGVTTTKDEAAEDKQKAAVDEEFDEIPF